MKIENIELKKILNSKKNETIQAVVSTKKTKGIAASPAGTSAGAHEKKHFDDDINRTIQISKPILKKIIGYDTSQQTEIDAILREIPGAASISTSIAVACAAANEKNVPLWMHLNKNAKIRAPTAVNLMFAGGKHAPLGPEFQEFLALQEGLPIDKQREKNWAIYKELEKNLHLKERDSEYGWITNFTNEQCLNELKQQSCSIGTDAAASEFYKNERYIYKKNTKTKDEQIQYVIDMIEKYKIRYFEDPLQEEDFEGFSEILKNTKNCLIVGDDLTTTNKQRVQKAINERSINAVVIKPNQIGTLTEAIDTIKLAQKNNIKCVTSHRAGETKDTWLSHITLAFNVPYIKISIDGEEDLCKLNELQKQLKKQ